MNPEIIMLSKPKTAKALIDWIRDQLVDTGGTRSLKDDADGVAIYVCEVRADGASLFVDVAVVGEGKQKNYEFILRTGRKVPVIPRVNPTPAQLAELDETA